GPTAGSHPIIARDRDAAVRVFTHGDGPAVGTCPRRELVGSDAWRRERRLDAVLGLRAAAKADLVELESRTVGFGGEATGVAHRPPIAAIERRDLRPTLFGVVGPLVDVADHVERTERAHAV